MLTISSLNRHSDYNSHPYSPTFPTTYLYSPSPHLPLFPPPTTYPYSPFPHGPLSPPFTTAPYSPTFPTTYHYSPLSSPLHLFPPPPPIPPSPHCPIFPPPPPPPIPPTAPYSPHRPLGGKWTTYRSMAEETIDEAIRVCNLEPIHLKSSTKGLLLTGAHNWTPTLFIRLIQEFGLDSQVFSCSSLI